MENLEAKPIWRVNNGGVISPESKIGALRKNLVLFLVSLGKAGESSGEFVGVRGISVARALSRHLADLDHTI